MNTALLVIVFFNQGGQAFSDAVATNSSVEFASRGPRVEFRSRGPKPEMLVSDDTNTEFRSRGRG